MEVIYRSSGNINVYNCYKSSVVKQTALYSYADRRVVPQAWAPTLVWLFGGYRKPSYASKQTVNGHFYTIFTVLSDWAR